MRYLLDTNILCKRDRYQQARAWVNGHQDQVALSVITVAEMIQGIELLPAGEKRDNLTRILGEMIEEYPVLSFGLPEAQAWGQYVARQAAQGRKVATMDSLIAATALANRLWLVTENDRDFPDVDRLNPMTGQ